LVAKAEEAAVEEGSLEGEGEAGVHGPQVGEVLLRRELADVQAVKEPAQVAQLVWR
jgi:hypothetical protein